MSKMRLHTLLSGITLMSALSAQALASDISLRRDTVIPVVLEDKLDLADHQVGDSFTVRVTDDGPLPPGTEILGRIDGIHPAKGHRPSSMDLRFTRILMPDNSRVNIDAAVISLDARYLVRGKDGRLMAKQDIRKQQNDVLGGAIGGFIVGSLFHHRVAGAIIGTIAGAAVAESDREKDSNLIAKQGDKLGALMNRDVMIHLNDGGGRGIASHLDRPMSEPARQDSGRNRVREGDHNAPIIVTFQKTDMQFPSDARPYWIGATVMVPLEPAANQLALDVDRHKDRTVSLNGKDINMELTEFSRDVRLNGDLVTLPRTVVIHNGVVFVPLDALVMMVKDPVFLNGTKYEART